MAKETKITVTRLRKLLSGDRPTDEEIEKLSGCLVKLDGLVLDRDTLAGRNILDRALNTLGRREFQAYGDKSSMFSSASSAG